MADHTTDIEKESDSKEVSVEVTEKRGPHHYEDNVPRSKGIFGKVGVPITCNFIRLVTILSYGISSIDWTELSPEELNESYQTRGTTPNAYQTACGCGWRPTPPRQLSLSGPSVLPYLVSSFEPQSSPLSSSTFSVQFLLPSSPHSAQSSVSAN